MRVTENLKNKVRAAKAAGYTHVESVRNTHYNSRYSNFYSVDSLLNTEVGVNNSLYAGVNVNQWYKNNPGAKTLGYQELFYTF